MLWSVGWGERVSNLLSNSSANRILGKVQAEAAAAERAALKKSFHLFRGGKNTP